MNIYTEFEKELLERIGNIESRLETIERMLGAESKPEQLYRVDTKARSLLTPVSMNQEPEWRPMSTAPTNGELILARTFSGIDIYVSFDVLALECHWRDTDNNGWSYEDLTGWRPL